MNKELKEKIKKEKIIINIKGLKCDNPNCDYMDTEIPFEDYPKWVDCPCPKCGGILLTKQDYDTTVSLVKKANFLKKYSPPIYDDTPLSKVKVHLNGSGLADFEICPLKEE